MDTVHPEPDNVDEAVYGPHVEEWLDQAVLEATDLFTHVRKQQQSVELSVDLSKLKGEHAPGDEDEKKALTQVRILPYYLNSNDPLRQGGYTKLLCMLLRKRIAIRQFWVPI